MCVHVCVYVCMYICVCVSLCVCLCMHACVCARVCLCEEKQLVHSFLNNGDALIMIEEGLILTFQFTVAMVVCITVRRDTDNKDYKKKRCASVWLKERRESDE